MQLTEIQKKEIKNQLVSCLSSEKEIVKIIIFGSFLSSDDPKDIDIAVFQDSEETYLPLAMKYRKKIRPLSVKIPFDIFPVKSRVKTDPFLTEIERGEIIYER